MAKVMALLGAAAIAASGLAAATLLAPGRAGSSAVTLASARGTTGTTGTTTTARTTGTRTTVPTTAATAGPDISGPCDEAENANRPRCTGAAVDDRRGRRAEPADDGNRRGRGPGRRGRDDGPSLHRAEPGDDQGRGRGRGRGRGGG